MQLTPTPPVPQPTPEPSRIYLDAGAREGSHLSVVIVSARFAGLPRVARHRLVYDALSTLMPQGIHALAIDARAPEEP